MLIWLAIIIVLVLILVILYLEVYFYEGVHLGARVQGWLYDQWADQYDRDKQSSQAQDALMLARPLLERLAGLSDVWVLDVATGTGRLPLALLNEPDFKGRLVALDISRKMLVCAARKLAPYRERVTLMRHPATPLPFPDHTFDVVSCLEALELLPDMHAPLTELVRVLRPGGVLLTSRGTEASGRVGQVRSPEKFTMLLQSVGLEQIEIVPWWKNFDRVRARKPGTWVPAGPRALTEILSCPSCKAVAMIPVEQAWRCQQCGILWPLTPEGIILC